MTDEEQHKTSTRSAARPDNVEPKDESAAKEARLLDRFTWANFTCTQSTGGVAILLSESPPSISRAADCRCRSLHPQPSFRPSNLRKSLTNPPEAYFTGSLWLSMATIIMCMQRFGAPHAGPWVIVAIRILFWTYAAITLAYNIVIFVVMFAVCPLKPGTMSPPMFLMIYNAMLTGTVASSIAAYQPLSQRMAIIVTGIAFQGLGWILCTMFLPLFVGNMLINGLGPANQRPGLFISVGSSGYTIVALIGCAKAIPDGYGYFAKHPTASETLNVMALWIGIFLWLFTFWLFAIALVAQLPIMIPKRVNNMLQPKMSFTLPWWAIIFPNVGFTIATIRIGEELESNAIAWVATFMTILVFAAWLMDLFLHLKSIFQRRIM
ncbi:C4-dicarboxylate transporter/malic acid transport protein [Penicillium cosmopolitanum]|uniref:C4-dicarboxylate transporter/malic acid transport protein n=1 Tax=Penicillium cosmopolitanum TaxID=1131564 RepID=A0A9X0B4B0_9EURO|nr:C4-dicarboxylate transporter/malic acid transport protein [Penicillium cosmopolitanum]KAJ5387575.1 C4-dicarboxylate transporter/malic acid transport protein [Penicillium cosmopolitanum]